MNKIMMAVLQALQDEQEQAAEKAAEQGIHAVLSVGSLTGVARRRRG